MTHTLTLQHIEPVTPDTHRLRFRRPEGYDFTPGQAVDMALDKDGWREETRPFTFVSLPDETALDFVIKSYPDHDGVTEQIGRMQPGDKVIISAPWGAIHDEGPGWFIAGGAGLTPFLSVLRKRLEVHGTLAGCTLLYSNKTEADIILRRELEAMEGLEAVFVVTDEEAPGEGVEAGRIDRDFLAMRVTPEIGHYYICGPEKMVEEVSETLRGLGVEEARIVVEDFD